MIKFKDLAISRVHFLNNNKTEKLVSKWTHYVIKIPDEQIILHTHIFLELIWFETAFRNILFYHTNTFLIFRSCFSIYSIIEYSLYVLKYCLKFSFPCTNCLLSDSYNIY